MFQVLRKKYKGNTYVFLIPLTNISLYQYQSLSGVTVFLSAIIIFFLTSCIKHAMQFCN